MKMSVRLNSHKTDLQDQCGTFTKHKLNDNTEVSVHDILTHRHHSKFQIKAIYFNRNERDSTYLRGLIPLQGMHDVPYGKTSDKARAVPSAQELLPARLNRETRA